MSMSMPNTERERTRKPSRETADPQVDGRPAQQGTGRAGAAHQPGPDRDAMAAESPTEPGTSTENQPT